MDIPINVNVYCQDGLAGRAASLVINPSTDELTHLVVQKSHQPHEQFLVPIDQIASTTPSEIRLKFPLKKLDNMDRFLEAHLIRVDKPHVVSADPYYAWPIFTHEEEMVMIDQEQVPAGEMVLHRGARVEASDGFVGKVDEFLVEPGTSHISHLVLKEGHLWAARDISIPISEIRRIDSDTVYLKLTRHEVGKLPAMAPERAGK